MNRFRLLTLTGTFHPMKNCTSGLPIQLTLRQRRIGIKISLLTLKLTSGTYIEKFLFQM